ncbi:phosphonate ABC transporter, permease protein PhnE [Roseixanthobacter pseudopolyaromaticivorans]|uniref:phosphonate ABC transporter, permease protein PhnE n=1 Tax=Xanthobacteraceae TaxID=335928 RepID=UPI00372CC894
MSRARLTPTAQDRARLAKAFPQVFAPSLLQRALTLGAITLLVLLALYAMWRLEFSFARIGSGIRQLWLFVTLMVPPDPGTQLNLYIHALGETLSIAFLGTFCGALLALPMGFIAARNVVPNLVIHMAMRRFMDVLRGVDRLIWALIFVTVVGLGPFAGILAIATASAGIFAKLFSEAIEATDRKAVEGILSTGGSAVDAVRFGLLPQVMPVLTSQVLYIFESNSRQSTIVGIVGAGGLGLHLVEQIRVLEWQKVSFLILMMLVMVAVIDFISSRLRFAIIGRKEVV